MPDITITSHEGVVTTPAATVGTTVTVNTSSFMGARSLLLESGVDTPPDTTPAGTLLFQKGA